jgi:hypothetical protein
VVAPEGRGEGVSLAGYYCLGCKPVGEDQQAFKLFCNRMNTLVMITLVMSISCPGIKGHVVGPPCTGHQMLAGLHWCAEYCLFPLFCLDPGGACVPPSQRCV